MYLLGITRSVSYIYPMKGAKSFVDNTTERVKEGSLGIFLRQRGLLREHISDLFFNMKFSF